MNERALKKILVIQTAFIGDVVLATGILEKLHVFYPDASLDFLVRKGNEGLLKEHPFIHKTIIWNKQEGKWRHLFQLLQKIRHQQYDLVINVQRFAATGMLTALSGAKQTIGYDKNPWSRFFSKSIPHIISTDALPKHEVSRCNDLIATVTDDTVYLPKLHPTAADFLKVHALKSLPYITIAPASVWFTKQYPMEKWIAFIHQLPVNIKVYLLGAPTDEALCNKIVNATHEGVINMTGKLSFLQSAALMKDAVMNYVNDSAPMHFASAVNAPVTAVYCSTVPAFGFGPLSDRQWIVEAAPALPCKPCGLHGHSTCPEGHFNCAFQIKESQLLAAIP